LTLTVETCNYAKLNRELKATSHMKSKEVLRKSIIEITSDKSPKLLRITETMDSFDWLSVKDIADRDFKAALSSSFEP